MLVAADFWEEDGDQINADILRHFAAVPYTPLLKVQKKPTGEIVQ